MTALPTLTWSDELVLQQPRMDATHREFVDLLAALEAALGGAPAEVDDALATLAEHTVEQRRGLDHQLLRRPPHLRRGGELPVLRLVLSLSGAPSPGLRLSPPRHLLPKLTSIQLVR